MRVSPIRDLLVNRGAIFEQVAGVERARQFSLFEKEYRAVRQAVGLTDFSFTTRYRVPEAGLDLFDQYAAGAVANIRFGRVLHTMAVDDSGWLESDLYIANDFGPNQLFENDGGTFVDQSHRGSSQDWGFGMSATWGDYNRDGLMDLYVSSMFSGAGNQVVAQADFNPTMPEETRRKYLKMVRGNSLLENSAKSSPT